MPKPFIKLLTFLFILISSLSYSYAQTTQASFIGKVTDAESKPLANASVIVRNESTGFNATTLTNAKGDFVFKELPSAALTPYMSAL